MSLDRLLQTVVQVCLIVLAVAGTIWLVREIL